jgi:tetratricopeptide (TPR) repeat protein
MSEEDDTAMAPERANFDADPSRVVCPLLIVLLVLVSAGTTNAASPQAQVPSSQNARTLPPACQNLGKSNQRIGDFLTNVANHATAKAYNALGVLYAEDHKLNCAVPAFEQAVRLDHQDWGARYNLALALIEKGEAAKAADQLHILIQQSPNTAAAHNTFGNLLQRQGKLEAAAEEFRTALQNDPGFALASLNLGEVLITQERYTAATVYLQNALKSSPPPDLEIQLQSTLAVAYAEKGDSRLAIEMLGQVIKSHPDASEAYFNLATVYARNAPALSYKMAIANFKEALRIDPHYDEARCSLAKVLLELGQFSDAIPYLTDYVQDQPSDAEGFRLLGSAYTGLSQPAKAVEVLERAKQLKPGNYQIRYDLGSAFAKVGNTDEAIEQLAMAEKINPNFADTHYQLALQLRKKGDVTRSEQEVQVFQGLKNRKDEEESAGILNNEGNRLLKEGKVCEAAEVLRKAVQLDPDNARWHYNLSLALTTLDDRQGEKEELEKALNLAPNMAPAHNDLGLVYLSEGRLNEAEKEFRLALEIDPNFAEPQNNLGVVHSRQGKDP